MEPVVGLEPTVIPHYKWGAVATDAKPARTRCIGFYQLTVDCLKLLWASKNLAGVGIAPNVEFLPEGYGPSEFDFYSNPHGGSGGTRTRDKTACKAAAVAAGATPPINHIIQQN